MEQTIRQERGAKGLRSSVNKRRRRAITVSVVGSGLIAVICAGESPSVSKQTDPLQIPASWEELFGGRKEILRWELADKLEANQHLITADNIESKTAEKLAEYYDFLWTELKLVEYLDHNTGRLARKAQDERDPQGAAARALERAEEARKRRELMVRCATLSRWYRSLHKDHLEDKDVEHLHLVHVYLYGPDSVPLDGMAKQLKAGKYVSSTCLAVLREFYRAPPMASAKSENFRDFLYRTTMPDHQEADER